MIEILNLTKRFHAVVAVDNVSLRISQGEVLGMLGPNGAGKTTLFKLISGILRPDKGILRPIGRQWPFIGYKPERLLFPNHLSVTEYLRMVAVLANVPGSEINVTVQRQVGRVGLTAAVDKRIGELSKGMRQRLALAQATMGDPPLLLLDEPSNGLDPEGQADICRYIKSLHGAGHTVVLASHQLQEVTQVCTELVILNEGSVHYQNTMEAAMALQPHAVIRCRETLDDLRPLLTTFSPDIVVDGTEMILAGEAMTMRPRIMSVLLAAGHDIIHVEQSRTTLAEIYAQALK